VWEYGIGQTVAAQADPYKQGATVLTADVVFGSKGSADGQLDDPHGIAIAPDGSLFVADTNNNRIEHFAADGSLIKAWGSFADNATTPIPLGTFNQPWGIALSPDGEWLYVADTWNHRIEKFSADGSPVMTWGHDQYGQTDDPFGLWGPRGIAVNGQGNVFVADTGNKRIVVYTADGKFITQFGNAGMAAGQFDEPVGLAFDAQGNLYVADTWNQRVQVFAAGPDGQPYTALRQWDIAGWYGQSLENKPFLAIDNQDHVFVADPEMYRVLEFTTQGEFIRTWGDYGTDTTTFGLASAVAVDNQGHAWVSDAGNDRLMRFTLP
jgi:sugar lactone lactonase YvrE